MAKESDEEMFSDDPEEQMNIENEILKLKLQAELGGSFESEGVLPPDVENAFLKNVIEFEHQFAKTTPVTLYEILENPYYPPASELSDDQIENELYKLEELMNDKGIVVDYSQHYDSRIKYKFITEELFPKESGFVQMPGMTMHYIYEEFHPNHEQDIRNNAEDFFDHWINQNFSEYSNELSLNIKSPDGKEISREELLQRFQHIFDSYTSFSNSTFTITDVSFDLSDSQSGVGYAKGEVSYDAEMENGELKQYKGDFTLTMRYNGYWNITAIHWPGLLW